MKQCLYSVFFVALSYVSVAAAELPLVVQDTAGVVRSSAQVEELGSITFEVAENSAPANGAEVTLTNVETGQSLTGVSVNGTVVFEGVPPGTWTVASLSPNITFTSVSVMPSLAVAGPLGIGLTGGTAVAAGVGGAAAIGAATLAITESQNDDNEEGVPPLSAFQ